MQETKADHLKTSVHSAVKYDLIGKLAAETKLTRSTIGAILLRMRPTIFVQYRTNPEDFIRKTAQLINEEEATVIVEHLSSCARVHCLFLDGSSPAFRRSFSR